MYLIILDGFSLFPANSYFHICRHIVKRWNFKILVADGVRRQVFRWYILRDGILIRVY